MNFKVPPPPSGLSAAAKKVWKDISAEWVLAADTLILLKTALEAYDRMQQAKRQIDKDGITVTSASGLLRTHPSLRTEKEAGGRFLQAWRQLGFGQESPTEVGRIGRPGG